MKHACLLAAVLQIGPCTFAQEIENFQPESIQPGNIQPDKVQPQKTGLQKVRPAGKVSNAFLALSGDVAHEISSTTRDIVTVRDPQWTLLTIAQIGAAAADAKTSLVNLKASPACQELGVSRIFVGARPDAHKYIIAGAVEIAVEAVTAHYMRNHGPTQKWYWRYAWTLPQSLSLYGHARAANNNTRVNFNLR